MLLIIEKGPEWLHIHKHTYKEGRKGTTERKAVDLYHPKSYTWFCFPYCLQGLVERTPLQIQNDKGLTPCSAS